MRRGLSARLSAIFPACSAFRLRPGFPLILLALLALWACDETLLENGGTGGVQTTGIVEGSVFLDADGNGTFSSPDVPMPDIGVRIVTAGAGSTVATAVTDGEGEFRMDSVPVGEYRFRVDAASIPDSVRAFGVDSTSFLLTPGDVVVRDFRLSFPTYSLEEVRALGEGMRVFTHGIALNPRFPFGDGVVHVREGDTFLRITDAERSSVAPQDSVRVQGRTAREAGRPILTDARVFILQPEAVQPFAPERVTAAQAAGADDERLDAALVEIRDARIMDTIPEGDDLVVTVDDGTGTVDVHFRDFLQFDRSAMQPGTRQLGRAVGLLVPVEDGAGEVRWRITPRTTDDVTDQTWVPPTVSTSESTVEASPSSVLADGEEVVTVTVTLRTSGGDPIGDERSVVVTVQEGPGDPASAGAEFDADSRTYSATLTSTAAGTSVIGATADGVALAQQVQVAFNAGPPAMMDAVEGQGQTGGVGEALPEPLEVKVADAFGNPVAGVGVSWTPGGTSGSGDGSSNGGTSGGDALAGDDADKGTADPPVSETDGDGRATTVWTLGSEPGTYTLVASVAGTDETVTFTATAERREVSATQSTLVAEPTAVVADGETASTLTVTLRDADRNLIEDEHPVTLEIVEGPGELSTSSPVFDAATSTYSATIVSAETGTATVAATVGADDPADEVTLAEQAQVQFTAGDVSAETSSAVAEPTTVVADGTAASTITVTLRDGEGNVIDEARTVVLEVSDGPGELAATSPAFDPATNSYVTTLTSTQADTATISVAADGVTLADAPRVAFVPGPANEVAITAGDGQSATVGETLADALEVRVTDAFGNPVEGTQVTWAAAQGSADPTSSLTDADGRAGTSWTLGTDAGGQSLVATAEGVDEGVTFTATALAGEISASVSTVSADPETVTADGTAASTVTVELRDTEGNEVAGLGSGSFSVALSPDGTAQAGAVTETGTAGIYTFEVTNTAAEEVTVTVTAGGVTLDDAPVIDFVPGEVSASESSLEVDPETVTADGDAEATLTVTLRDGQGNLIDEARTVTLAVVEGPGELSTTTPAFDPATSTYSATISSTQSGEARVSATVAADPEDVTLDQQAVIEFTAGEISASESDVTADPETVVADGAAFSTVTVEVRDALGNPVAGLPASEFLLNAGGASMTGIAETGTAGTYEFRISSAVARTVAVTVTVSGVALDAEPQVEFVPGPIDAARSLVGVDPASVTADGEEAATVRVTLRDAQDNVIGDEVPVTLEIVEGPGELATTTPAFNAADSTYSTTITSTETGTATLAATADGLALDARPTVQFTVGDVSGTESTAEAEPSVLVADGIDAATITITVRDGEGNVIDEPRPVTLSTAEGIGQFADTQPAFDPATNTYTTTLTSQQAGLATIVVLADGETIVPEPQVEFLPGDVSAAESLVDAQPETVTADGIEQATVSVTLRDQFGNVVVEPASVVLALDGPGTLGTTTPAFNPADSTYSTTLASTQAGTATVSAEADGLALDAEAVVEFVAGAVSSTVSSVGAEPDAGVVADGTDASTVTVELRDAEGNEVPGLEDGDFGVVLVGDGADTPVQSTAVAETGTAGTYQFQVTNVSAETVTVTVTADGVQLADQPTIGFVAGAAATMTIQAGQNQTGTVGTALPTALEVEVLDANQNPVPGAEVTWTPASGSGSADPNPSVTDASGRAQTTWTLGETPGTHTLTASAGGATADFTATAEVGSVSATESSASANPTTGVTADGTASSTVTVVLRDEFGNRIAGLSEEDFLIELDGDGADQAEAGPITALSSPPRYVFDVTNTAAETVTVTITADGVTLEAQPTIGFVAGAAATMTIEGGQGQTGTVGTLLLDPLVVEVLDANQNPVAGVEVTWTPAAGSGTANPVTTVTDALGRAQSEWTLGTEAGTQTLTGSADGVDPAQFTATAEAGDVSAETSSVEGSPTTVTADGEDAATISVTLRDQFENVVVEPASVVLTLGGPGALGTTTPTFNPADSTYSTTLTSTDPGTATVTAEADGLALDAEAVVEFVVGAISPAVSSVSADPNAGVVADGTDASTVTVELRDAEGNEVSGLVDGDFGVVLVGDGDNTAVQSTPVAETGTAGTYQFQVTNVSAETVTVTVSADGVQLADQPTIGFVAGAAATMTIEAGDGQTGTVGSALANLLEVEILDANQNPVADVEVTWTPAAGSGTANPVTSLTDAFGRAQTEWTLGTEPGTQTLTASADGVDPVQFTATAEAGDVSAETSSVEGSPTTVTADGEDAATISVTLRDQFENVVVEPASVVLTLGGPGALGTTTPTFNPADSTYSTTLTSTQAGTATVSAEADGLALDAEAVVEFVAGAPASVSVETLVGLAVADGSDELEYVVTVRDGGENLLSGVTVVATHDGIDVVFTGGGDSQATGEAGTVTFTATSGTTQTLTFTFTEQENENFATAAGEFSDALEITTSSLADWTVDHAGYSETLTASGGTEPYTWTVSSGALPTGLALDETTGAITGTPTAEGEALFTVQVTDANAFETTGELSIMVHPQPSITTTVLPDGMVGEAYSETLVSTGGTAPLTWAVTVGTLPAGLTLNGGTGEIGGTPTTAGSSTFTVTVTDDVGAADSQELTLTITETLEVTTTTLPEWTVAQGGFSGVVEASGGTAPYTWAVSDGAVPTGMALESDGTFSGTPTETGTFGFTVEVTDANGFTATAALSITINPQPSVTTENLPDGMVGEAYSETLVSAGGTAPVTWAVTVGTLPAGLTLNGGTGEIAGTPTTAGSSTFTVTVTDDVGASDDQEFTIVVQPAEDPQ